MLAAPVFAAPATPEIRFSAEVLDLGQQKLHGVEARLEPGGAFAFSAARLETGSSDIPLADYALSGELQEWSLPEGGFRGKGQARVRGLETHWELESAPAGTRLCLSAPAQAVEAFAGEILLPETAPRRVKAGETSACARYEVQGNGADRAVIEASVANLSFDTPDGLYAGEGLAFEVVGGVTLSDPPLARFEGGLTGGQVLLDLFYADFSAAPLRVAVEPVFRGTVPAAYAIDAWDEGAFRAQIEARPDSGGQGWVAAIARLDLHFPAAYSRYIEPVAAAWTLDGLEVTGSVGWNGSVGTSGLHSGDLDISDLSVVDTRRRRFALTGLDARLRPGDHGFDSTLDWRGLLLGRINLGAGSAALDSQPGAFALARPLELDVLGGQLRFERLRYVLPGSPADEPGGSRFEMEAAVDAVDMDRLTAALGWPRFSGRLSGAVPGVRLEDGVLSAEGEVRVEVFGGAITVSGLQAERPFGVLPSLSADIVLHDLDLEQLTETFEFGRIGGRVDGYVSDLRLLDWQPVAFDAWVGTPERQARTRSISRQAVRNLTEIGGGGATAALTSPLMRMFSSFSYRRLGLGCRLRNHVCEVRGISDDGDSVLLLEGAGLPKITVRAWNRSVDWSQMVANLSAIGSGREIRVGDAPDP